MSKVFTSLCILLPLFLFGQNQECAHDEIFERQLAKNSVARQAYEGMEQRMLDFFLHQQSQGYDGSAKSQPIDFVIPVVVHIIHQNGPENVSDATVHEAIQNLNDGFAHTGPFANGEGADVGIQFCLAQRDPDGNFTTGINRVESPFTNITLAEDDSVIALIRWPRQEYLNIWVVDKINNGLTNGFSNFPPPSNYTGNGDGIFVDDIALGYVNSAILLHEAGHYLALLHTFANGCQNNNCLTDGDRVCDTPPDNNTAGASCSVAINSCSTDTDSGYSTDQDDLNWNFMDYGYTPCHTGFTQGQVDRMRYALEFERTSLLSSKGCQTPCFFPITGGFDINPAVPQVGQTVEFINTTSGGTNFEWLVDGVPFSTGVNASTSFAPQGQYEVTLLASNNDSLCDEAITVTVEVVCPAQAGFNASDLETLAGNSVFLTNTSINPGGTYQWLVDGVPLATTGNAFYTLPTDGDYIISLVAQTADQVCRDTFSRTVRAVCIDADFFVSDFYPQPGDLVAFLNESQGASSFTWTANGVAIGTSTDLNHAFQQAGVYEVCLEASTPFCSDQLCQEVYVFEEYDGGCGGTYMKRLANFSQAHGHCTAAAPDGSVFMGGGTDSAALLVKLNTEGEVIWSRTFEQYPDGEEIIHEIMFDSDGMMVLRGSGTDYYDQPYPNDNFVMKYDPQNDTVLWTRQWDNITYQSNFRTIKEKTPGGNYVAVGNLIGDPFYFEMDRNTGQKVMERHFSTGNDYFGSLAVLDNAIYVAGYEGNFFNARRRPSLIKFDTMGNRLWTRRYANDPTELTASTFHHLLVEEDTIVAFGSGSLTHTNSTNSLMILAKTDLDGNLYWGKTYTIGNAVTYPTKLLALPDGYLLFAWVTSGGGSGYYVLRLDTQGNVVWAKRIAVGSGVSTEYATLQNGAIHFTSYSGFTIGKMSLDGEISGVNCNVVSDLNVTVGDLPGNDALYNEVELVSKSIPFVPKNFAFQEAAYTSYYQAGCECEEPVDPCFFASDAVLTTASATCQGESMSVSLAIYNNSTGDIAAGTPVSFYDSDPTNGAATLLATLSLTDSIEQATSATFTFSLTSLTNTPIFAVVNDDATTPTPFSLDTFPNGSTMECFFQNNMRSFQINYTPPTLNLGPDVAFCDAGTATFHAQPGFASYEWFDGSFEPSYTAWLPGTYWVRVTDACGGIQADSIELTIIPGTIANIGSDTIAACPGEVLTFSLSGFDHYLWLPANAVSCDTCASVSTVASASGTISVLASTDDGCFSSDSVRVELLTLDTVYQDQFFCEGDIVEVFGSPVTQPGTYSMTFSDSEGCDSTAVVTLHMNPGVSLSYQSTEQVIGFYFGTITVSASGGTAPFHYFWSNGAPDTSYIDGLVGGNYSVTVVDVFGCSATAEIIVQVGTGTSVESNIQQFSIGPNPTSGRLNVSLVLHQPATVQLEILDILGQVVRSTHPILTMENTWEMDLSELAAATYFCKLTVDGRASVRSFVKQ